ncbi:MAG: hypothetical protein J6X12_09175, partial [Paludibacteraceae bacterium]|nr:hypothetical protein [Paludibacteraceae bacterium]
RFGPYIAYNGANYKIPKSAVPADLTVEECQKLIEEQGEKKPARRSRATAKSTAAKSTDTAEKKSTAKKSTAKKTTSAKSTTTKTKSGDALSFVDTTCNLIGDGFMTEVKT